MTGIAIAGHCPACARRTLFAGHEGNIICTHALCPDPTVLTELLDQRRPERHVAWFDEEDWTLEHPLRCRIDGLADCEVHAAKVDLAGPPAEGLGRYEVTLLANGELVYSRLTEDS